PLAHRSWRTPIQLFATHSGRRPAEMPGTAGRRRDQDRKTRRHDANCDDRSGIPLRGHRCVRLPRDHEVGRESSRIAMKLSLPPPHTYGPITRTDLVRYAGASGDFNPLDRKSTRLNSSHVKISYAVFCL